VTNNKGLWTVLGIILGVIQVSLVGWVLLSGISLLCRGTLGLTRETARKIFGETNE